MKTALKMILLTTLAGSLFLTGCARQYVVTLENGSQLSVIGKPKKEGGSYVAKGAQGQEIRIPVTRVREIAPASMAGAQTSSGVSEAPRK